MFSLYSKKCEYVLRGLAQIGKNPEGQRFRAADFCRDMNLPESFTRKALQELVHAGILKAIQGPGGGYLLVRPADEISALDVIYAIEGANHFSSCVMGFAECNALKPCGLHDHWTCAKKQLLKNLQKETVATLLKYSDRKTGKGSGCRNAK